MLRGLKAPMTGTLTLLTVVVDVVNGWRRTRRSRVRIDSGTDARSRSFAAPAEAAAPITARARSPWAFDFLCENSLE